MIPRRLALLGAAAGVLPAAAPADLGPDARLIALCGEMVACDAERDAILTRYAEVVGDFTYTEAEIDRIDELGARYAELDREVAAIRAATPAAPRWPPA